MLALVEQWRESGKSGTGFAREDGLTIWTLFYWRDVADGRAGVGSTGRASNGVSRNARRFT